MKSIVLYVICAIIFQHSNSTTLKKPTVLIGILVRNKAHVLPYTLSYLEKLNYPKNRIALWFYSDNNIDNSIEILKTWLSMESGKYFLINTSLDEKSAGHRDEKGYSDWSPMRFTHIIKLREEILNFGRKIWADYIFMLDADVFLINPNTLELLISKNKTVTAPLLKSDGMYSNFWAGMTPDFYYKRTDAYEPILNRHRLGCFSVPMVHSALLINLKASESDYLTYLSNNLQNYKGPIDDIITFALSANSSNVSLYICNDEIYGFVMVPLESKDTIQQDLQQLVNTKLEILTAGKQESVEVLDYLKRFVSFETKDNLGLSQIYMINLLRRPERRKRMLACFDALGIEAEIIDAMDGKTLNEALLKTWGINLMPEYKDPYRNRPIKMGEVGCFLSHHFVWNKIIEDGHETAMVLEDDVKFEPFFQSKLKFLLKELKKLNIDWDLIYLGRKALQRESESYVPGTKYLTYPGYSYWTIGYLLSANGARKLVESKVLDNLLPVDEFLPIMFDKHPRSDWMSYFPERNLIALSAEPFLIYPTHYTNDSGYLSDTENSIQLSELPSHQHANEL